MAFLHAQISWGSFNKQSDCCKGQGWHGIPLFGPVGLVQSLSQHIQPAANTAHVALLHYSTGLGRLQPPKPCPCNDDTLPYMVALVLVPGGVLHHVFSRQSLQPCVCGPFQHCQSPVFLHVGLSCRACVWCGGAVLPVQARIPPTACMAVCAPQVASRVACLWGVSECVSDVDRAGTTMRGMHQPTVRQRV